MHSDFIESVCLALLRADNHLVSPVLHQSTNSTALVCMLSKISTRPLQRHPLLER
jgi:hypothetical protein